MIQKSETALLDHLHEKPCHRNPGTLGFHDGAFYLNEKYKRYDE